MTDSTLSQTDAVLLVEDDDSIALPLRCGLERAGRPVERVSTAAEALDRVAEGFALVVLDTRLPDMAGDRLVAHIVSQRPEQAVLVMTQAPASGEGPQASQTVSRLPMPFSLRDLLAEVHSLVGHAPNRVPETRSRYDQVTSLCREATPETVVGQVPQNVV